MRKRIVAAMLAQPGKSGWINTVMPVQQESVQAEAAQQNKQAA